MHAHTFVHSHTNSILSYRHFVIHTEQYRFNVRHTDLSVVHMVYDPTAADLSLPSTPHTTVGKLFTHFLCYTTG